MNTGSFKNVIHKIYVHKSYISNTVYHKNEYTLHISADI